VKETCSYFGRVFRLQLHPHRICISTDNPKQIKGKLVTDLLFFRFSIAILKLESKVSMLILRFFQMRMASISVAAVFLVLLTANIGGVLGIRFVIDREECFSHKSEYGATVRFSFVVIKVEGAWHYNEDGVDLVVFIYPCLFNFYSLHECISRPLLLKFET